MATHSSILAWRIPMDRGAWWAAVHGGGRVRHDWVTKHIPHSFSSAVKVHEIFPFFFIVYCFSVANSRPTLCYPMDCSTPGFLVLPHLLEFAQTHFHWVNDAIQLSHPLSSPSPPAFNHSQHQSLFQWFSSFFQLGSQSFGSSALDQSLQWIFRVDFL